MTHSFPPRRSSDRSGSGSDVIVAVPRDESRDAGFQRRARSEADGVGQRIDVGKGARDVTRLHRLEITPCCLTELVLEDFDHAQQLHRIVVADGVDSKRTSEEHKYELQSIMRRTYAF